MTDIGNTAGDTAIAYVWPSSDRRVAAEFCDGLAITVRTVPRVLGFMSSPAPKAEVDRCRDALAEAFLASTADWLLWIDSDIAFAPDDVVALLDSADPEERPVISGVVFGMFDVGEMETWAGGEIVETEAACTGFALMHRSALDKTRGVDRRWFPGFYERCKLAGIPVHVNTGVAVYPHRLRVRGSHRHGHVAGSDLVAADPSDTLAAVEELLRVTATDNHEGIDDWWQTAGELTDGELADLLFTVAEVAVTAMEVLGDATHRKADLVATVVEAQRRKLATPTLLGVDR